MRNQRLIIVDACFVFGAESPNYISEQTRPACAGQTIHRLARSSLVRLFRRILHTRFDADRSPPELGDCRFSPSMIVGQVSNLPLLPNFSCLFLLVYPVGRLETCPTTKSTVPLLGGSSDFALDDRPTARTLHSGDRRFAAITAV
jgi:hypothetical protein